MALPAGAPEKEFVFTHDLYCSKLALEVNPTSTEDLQVKEVLETSINLELRDWKFSFIDYITIQ